MNTKTNGLSADAVERLQAELRRRLDAAWASAGIVQCGIGHADYIGQCAAFNGILGLLEMLVDAESPTDGVEPDDEFSRRVEHFMDPTPHLTEGKG